MFEKELIEAIIAGDQNKVRRLFQFGASVHPQGPFDPIPLNVAASYNRHKIIPFLVQEGARLDARDASENTPLHEAAAKGHVEAVQALLRISSDVLRARNPLGNTPLHLASVNNHADVIELLIEWQADVNCVNAQGNTPLHCAASAGALNALKALLVGGADFFAENHAGETALALSEKTNHQNVIQTLKNYIANQRLAAAVFLKAPEVGLPYDAKLKIMSYLPLFKSQAPLHRERVLRNVMEKIEPGFVGGGALSKSPYSYEDYSSCSRENTPMHSGGGSPSRT